MDGDIEEVENPDNPGGPSLFRFVMFKASEKVTHTKKVEIDKAKDDASEFDFTFDDVDLGWTMKASSKSLQNIAAGSQLSSGTLESFAMSNAANASGTRIPAKPVQASDKPWDPPLAIEDAKERDRMLCKTEEALRGSYGLSLKLSKVITQLPATVLGSTHKASLEKMDIVGKEQESQLRHISIHGTLPGQSRLIGVNELKTLIKSFQLHFDDLKKAVEMAAPLLKKVEKQQSSG